MASITITVLDIYVSRIREAFGKKGKLATVAEIQAELKDYIRTRVIGYESQEAKDKKREIVEKEAW